jgi:aerobic-type carbon monoxide dehydrogenase small subunit (CoxS/CutS family)
MAEEKNKISRREFLKDAGLVVGGATIGSMAIMSACNGEETTKTVTNTVTTTKTVSNPVTVTVEPGTPGVQSGVQKISMTVNGWVQELVVKPADTLRDVLRDQLGITSVKDMCNGYGACGSCTAIVDGRPILSCMTLAMVCNGAVVETTEGLARDKHPLIEAYVSNNCMQCGYCTPGFVITAKALLDKNPNPSEDDIKEALAGNLCRCGTYPHHILAIKEAAGS